MEGLKHFSHKHPLILSKYNNSPPDALCCGCNDPIIVNTHVYRCINTHISNTRDSSCTEFFLHETCANLPPKIQLDLHMEHMLILQSHSEHVTIFCRYEVYSGLFVYGCPICRIYFCVECASLERELDHPSHNHTLTLPPLKALHMCVACGIEGSKEFSYSCKTCLFWIHKSCAIAPAKLISKAHHNDHTLVLDYSLPEQYQKFNLPRCSLCQRIVRPSYWLYYCAQCRYFAHAKCALSAAESGEDWNQNEDEEDTDSCNLIHLPISEKEWYLLYQLIQQFAKTFSTSTDERFGNADKISHCNNGHSLILYDKFNTKNVVEPKINDKMICDGCVQPLSLPPDSFYGFLDCNFFLHSVCAAELPREFQHASHPEHKLIRCNQTSQPLVFFQCDICKNKCSGMFYLCDSCGFSVDIVCAAMPSKIKHDAHKHTLHQLNGIRKLCNACDSKRGPASSDVKSVILIYI